MYRNGFLLFCLQWMVLEKSTNKAGFYELKLNSIIVELFQRHSSDLPTPMPYRNDGFFLCTVLRLHFIQQRKQIFWTYRTTLCLYKRHLSKSSCWWRCNEINASLKHMFVHMSCYSIWEKVITYIKLTLKQDLIFSDIGYILLAWKLASGQNGDCLKRFFSFRTGLMAEFLWTIYDWITNWYRLVMEHYNEVSLSLTEMLM